MKDRSSAAVTVRYAALQGILSAGDAPLPFGEERLAEVRRISAAKFSTWDWIYGQSRKADLVHSAQLPCGTIEARISLDRGILTGLEFGGDFLGALPASLLAARLTGLRFEREILRRALTAVEVGDYFDGTSADGLQDLLFGA